MLTVETIGRIRREHFIKGKTIREISRDLKVSRNTVRKVLRSGETSFEYDREVQPRPKLGRWTAELDELLEGNTTKPFREQLTLIRIFEELRGRGYDGGYDAVRRYARRWAKERGQSTAAAYVPLSFAPGEAYQFDWSHEVVLLSAGTRRAARGHRQDHAGPGAHRRRQNPGHFDAVGRGQGDFGRPGAGNSLIGRPHPDCPQGTPTRRRRSAAGAEYLQLLQTDGALWSRRIP